MGMSCKWKRAVKSEKLACRHMTLEGSCTVTPRRGRYVTKCQARSAGMKHYNPRGWYAKQSMTKGSLAAAKAAAHDWLAVELKWN